MNQEIVIILKLLLERTFITTEELKDEINLSKRQITYRIDKINCLLKSKKATLISLVNNKDIILKAETREAVVQIIHQYDVGEKYYLSKNERIAYMYLMLFINLEYLSLNHFINSVKVSKSSVLLDFKDLVKRLKKSGIEVENNRTIGYYLKGSEVEIRRVMIKLVIDTLSNNHECKIFNLIINEFKLDRYQASKETICNLAVKHNIMFVEDRLSEFIYIFIFLKARIVSKSKNILEIP